MFAARTVQADNPLFSSGHLAVRTAPEPRTHTREIDIGGVRRRLATFHMTSLRETRKRRSSNIPSRSGSRCMISRA